MQGVRDGNQVVAKLGSYNGTPTTCKIENATGYLKAVIYAQTLSAPTVNVSLDEKDDNSVSSSLGLYQATSTLKTLKVTNADGYLRAVIM